MDFCQHGRIHIEIIIQDQIAGHDKIKQLKICLPLQRAYLRVIIRKGTNEFQIPGQRIRKNDNKRIDQHMQPVEIFLVVFYHMDLPCPPTPRIWGLSFLFFPDFLCFIVQYSRNNCNCILLCGSDTEITTAYCSAEAIPKSQLLTVLRKRYRNHSSYPQNRLIIFHHSIP